MNPEASRRQFLKQAGLSMAAMSLFSLPITSCASEDLSIQQVIDLILQQIPGDRNPNTVDTVKIGDPNWKVKGIATTFLATVPMIQKAAEAGVNLIITHEPTFYNHTDETDWLADDPVYTYKKQLLEEKEIVVWRFHDYWHQIRPDGILHGFLNRMGWQEKLDPNQENTCILEPISLVNLAKEFKQKLALKRTFYVGDGSHEIRRIGILPGSWGRGPHISLLQKDIDALAVGEVAEWETSEYVRDAAAAGMKKGLIILGHAESEEPGMAWCAEWLQQLFPKLSVIHIPSGDAFVGV